MAGAPSNQREVKKIIHTVEVIRHPEAKIVLPEKVPLRAVIEVLQRREQEEEQIVSLSATIDVYPWDGAYALYLAMEQAFGYAAQVEGWTDGWPPEKIKRNTIQVAAGPNGQTVGVPWGQFEVPGMEGHLNTGYTMNDDGRIVFQVTAEVKGKYKQAFNDLVELTRRIVKEKSIYRGRALDIKFTDERGRMNEVPPVKFVDVSRAVAPIFNRDLEDALEMDVMAYVRFPEQIREMRGSIKRGVLLAGEFGTGKTMAAAYIAKVGTDNGFTFIYCKPQDIPRAIDFAIQYAPAVVFAEDLDLTAIGDGDGRTDAVHQLLNKLDGIDTKGRDILCVFTTNYAERINEAMLRPGRIDAILHVEAPDAEAAVRIAMHYAKGAIDANDDYSGAGEAMNGMIPAVISEVVGRAQIRATVRSQGESRVVRAEDLISAASALRRERGLFKHERPKSAVDVLGSSLGTALGSAIAEGLAEVLVTSAGGNGSTKKSLAESRV